MTDTNTDGTIDRNCHSFRQGCVGCCINMRWGDEKVLGFFEINSTAAEKILPTNGHPRLIDLVRLHLARGGWKDHLLAFLLVMPTLGVSAWVWNRFFASCQFAGFLDKETGRVGCLVHPQRVGYPDCRKHAFPLIPTAGCNRKLRCPMLDSRDADLSWGNVKASGEGWKSLKSKRKLAGCRFLYMLRLIPC